MPQKKQVPLIRRLLQPRVLAEVFRLARVALEVYLRHR